MKLIALLTLSLLITACGKNSSSGGSEVEIPSPVETLIGEFKSSNPRLPVLDLRNALLNEEFPAKDILDCGGDSLRGNSGQVNGVNEKSVLITGTETEGIIQFGHLLRVEDSVEDQCDVMTKEGYSYKVKGNTLTLCNLNCLAGAWGGSCQSVEKACAEFIRK